MAAGLDSFSSLIATEEHGQALRVHWKKEAGAPLLVRWCVIRCRDKCLRNGAFQGLSCVTGRAGPSLPPRNLADLEAATACLGLSREALERIFGIKQKQRLF